MFFRVAGRVINSETIASVQDESGQVTLWFAGGAHWSFPSGECPNFLEKFARAVGGRTLDEDAFVARARGVSAVQVADHRDARDLGDA